MPIPVKESRSCLHQSLLKLGLAQARNVADSFRGVSRAVRASKPTLHVLVKPWIQRVQSKIRWDSRLSSKDLLSPGTDTDPRCDEWETKTRPTLKQVAL